jgi:hypothetical protein
MGYAGRLDRVAYCLFPAGRVVISGSAKAEDRLMAGRAVLDRLMPIAVAQFMQDPKKEERLKEFEKLDFDGMNNRTDYVKKQGWATMPGEKEPDNRIAGQVADLLAKLKL